MIELVDYSKYLSFDNGKGLLLNRIDCYVLDSYGIDYRNCLSISDLILIIGKYLDDSEIYELEDLELVLSNLMEVHYYNETKK